ncbi:hypothetical protein AFCDBAGC_3356 [Methylobacterium cerastii]|uniref:Uncharacterized protein n=1 Tax=Methylobacterium cerastii TaxID=932741 RepID=A0ABQ4QJR2_9HYPH|nr:phage terminase large subunit family protein [Methylobacterium cerastii]GJD45483.1 hypothetical protein AFCDBAGC_3356 [Methylobacterium cerastii]
MSEHIIIFDEVDPYAWTEGKVELGDCRYRSDATPYLVELMKRFGDHPIERVMIRMPSQVGNTRSVIFEAIQEAMARGKDETP